VDADVAPAEAALAEMVAVVCATAAATVLAAAAVMSTTHNKLIRGWLASECVLMNEEVQHTRQPMLQGHVRQLGNRDLQT
jgi:hypothetical protein